MFTLDQLNAIHHTLGKQAKLPAYLKALKAIGVERYDAFVSDGHSEYYGANGQQVVSPPTHKKLLIATQSDKNDFMKHLKLHEQGKTDYFEMSQALADSGIEKWTFNTHKMTIAYYDARGSELLVEAIG